MKAAGATEPLPLFLKNSLLIISSSGDRTMTRCIAATLLLAAASASATSESYVENEATIAVQQPGPHEGTGTTTAYPFFADADALRFVFRKRALHPGASIGLHVNDKDEVYYVLSGRGELTLAGTVREVGPGDAVLTRDGDAHGLRQVGDEDLVILVVYPVEQK
jgi:quercetin dioxygenase-like cupin family protein